MYAVYKHYHRYHHYGKKSTYSSRGAKKATKNNHKKRTERIIYPAESTERRAKTLTANIGCRCLMNLHKPLENSKR